MSEHEGMLVKAVSTTINIAEWANYTTRVGDFNKALCEQLEKEINIKDLLSCDKPLVHIVIADSMHITPMVSKRHKDMFDKLYDKVKEQISTREFLVRLFRYLVLKKENKNVSN